MKDGFTKIKNRLVEVLKTRTIRADMTFMKRCFVKFDQFFANGFFVDKKWINIFKNREQRCGGKTPTHNVSMIRKMAFINKVELTTKSFRDPIKTWRFSISTLKLDFISRVWPSFRKAFLNVQTTFGIDKTSQVGKIFFSRKYGKSNRLQLLFNRGFDDISFKLKNLHRIHERISFTFVRRCSKLVKQSKLFLFLNKIGFNGSKLIQIFSPQNITIERFINFFRFFSGKNISPKKSLEKLNVFNFGSIDDKRATEFFSVLTSRFTDIKTAVSINITSSIGKIGSLKHIKYDSCLGGLSQ